MAEQIHSEHLRLLNGETKIGVGLNFPFFHGHWAGGAAGEGGVWHDGKKGAKVFKVTNEMGGTGMAQCNDTLPNGKPCPEIGPVQVLT